MNTSSFMRILATTFFYGRDFIFLSKIVVCAQEIKAP